MGDTLPGDNWAGFKMADAALSEYLRASATSNLKVLNVTHMTAHKKDAHSSVYYLGPHVGPAPTHRQDCIHWCLRGVPDAWNELLYALFLKYETTASSKTPTTH